MPLSLTRDTVTRHAELAGTDYGRYAATHPDRGQT